MDLINTLPVEVLCMVFDRLDLASVKNASLTCHRWNEIIFLSPCIRRFSLEIRIYYGSSVMDTELQQEETKRKIASLIETLEKSQRRYRQLECWHQAKSDSEFQRVWSALHPKITMHLDSMSFSGCMSSKVFSIIAEVIPSLLGLRWLALRNGIEDSNAQHTIPTLRSNSVKDLEISSNLKYRLDMPQLELFEGLLPVEYEHVDDSHGSFLVSNLKHLSMVLDEDSIRLITTDPFFFRRLTHLEHLRFEEDPVPSEILLQVCESCITLRELFIDGFNLTNPRDLQNLSKLINLRILKIWSTFDSSDLTEAIDLSKLVHLKILDLGDVSNIVKLSRSIRKLLIRITHPHDGIENIHNYLSSCSQLKKLDVTIFSLKHLNHVLSDEVMKALPFLKCLEVLTIDGGYLPESSFHHITVPLARLRKLQFINSTKPLNRSFLKQFFPNLTELTFQYCNSSSD